MLSFLSNMKNTKITKETESSIGCVIMQVTCLETKYFSIQGYCMDPTTCMLTYHSLCGFRVCHTVRLFCFLSDKQFKGPCKNSPLSN